MNQAGSEITNYLCWIFMSWFVLCPHILAPEFIRNPKALSILMPLFGIKTTIYSISSPMKELWQALSLFPDPHAGPRGALSGECQYLQRGSVPNDHSGICATIGRDTRRLAQPEKVKNPNPKPPFPISFHHSNGIVIIRENLLCWDIHKAKDCSSRSTAEECLGNFFEWASILRLLSMFVEYDSTTSP